MAYMNGLKPLPNQVNGLTHLQKLIQLNEMEPNDFHPSISVASLVSGVIDLDLGIRSLAEWQGRSSVTGRENGRKRFREKIYTWRRARG